MRTTAHLKWSGRAVVGIAALVCCGCSDQICDPAATFRSNPWAAAFVGGPARYAGLELTGNSSALLKVFDTGTGAMLARLNIDVPSIDTAGSGTPTSALSFDGTHYTMAWSGRIRTWNLHPPFTLVADESLVPTVLRPGTGTNLALIMQVSSQNGGDMVQLNGYSLPGVTILGSVTIPVSPPGCSAGPCSSFISADGQSVLLDDGSQIARYSLASGQVLSSASYVGHGDTTISSTSTDGTTAAVGGEVWDLSGPTAQVLVNADTVDPNALPGTGQVAGDGSRIQFTLNAGYGQKNYIVFDSAGAVITRSSDKLGAGIMDETGRFVAVEDLVEMAQYQGTAQVGTDVQIHSLDSGKNVMLANDPNETICHSSSGDGSDSTTIIVY